jgi:beta-glucosidase
MINCIYRPSKIACLVSILLLGTACGGGSTSTPNSTSSNVIPQGQKMSHAEADDKAKSILEQMTFDQKIQFVHGHGSPNMSLSYMYYGFPSVDGAMDDAVGYIPGIPELGIPDNNMVDASSGINSPKVQATALPSTVSLASSWDLDLARSYGQRIGQETRTLGFTTALGGGINLIRDPRNGRGYEYMGEDPILAGEMGAQRTIGVQSQGVMSVIKHFAFNNTENNRFVSNSVIDEQSMRETELLGFEIAIKKANPSYVMCSYNLVNSIYACENPILLNSILKNEWGFKGAVQSDWGAVSSTIASANNGLDEEEPSQADDDTKVPDIIKMVSGDPYFIGRLKTAISSGDVPMSRLDDMVFRKLRSMVAVGLMDKPPQSRSPINESAGNADALNVARKSMVLLKNDVASKTNDIAPVLPLSKSDIKTIAIIGMHADAGTLTGSGSGGSAPLIQNAVQSCTDELWSFYPGCPMFLENSPLKAIKAEFPDAVITFYSGEDLSAATAGAQNADVSIVFAGQWQVEGNDWVDMRLPSPATDTSGIFTYDQDELITSVAAVSKRSIVVLENGQAIEMPWLSDVDGVLEAWYPGIKGDVAIAEILSGKTNPSGKLPITFVAKKEDLVQPELKLNIGKLLGYGVFPKTLAAIGKSIADQYFGEGAYDAATTVNYSEKLAWNGYKWMDANNIKPLFAFGHGLSYSTFAYSDASSSVTSSGDVTVSFNLHNTSGPAGTEIAQVYATLPDNVPGNAQPPKKLVGWARVELAAGATKTVTVTVPKKYISTWDAQTSKRWITTPGNYVFTISDSSDTTSSNALTTTATLQ